ncbi:hypothetical protein [Natrinema amylolyticum]|uniref:hypothetical protein n=1 Tax=Natrinema amylolyticum TaxID=2878679 RepID=UPI001CFC3595|nr:hypothetical protein [Natrinema amylolyticum]
MELVSTPTLYCAECGEEIEDTGYLPATERDGEYEPLSDAAVCEACGFNDVGMMGCAPELDDVIDPDPDDTLLYVRVTDEGLDVLGTKE